MARGGRQPSPTVASWTCPKTPAVRAGQMTRRCCWVVRADVAVRVAVSRAPAPEAVHVRTPPRRPGAAQLNQSPAGSASGEIWPSGSDRDGEPVEHVGRTLPCGMLLDPPTSDSVTVVAVVVPISLCAPAGTHLRRIFVSPVVRSDGVIAATRGSQSAGSVIASRKELIWPPVP